MSKWPNETLKHKILLKAYNFVTGSKEYLAIKIYAEQDKMRRELERESRVHKTAANVVTVGGIK
jgi:hypothetical protein